MVWNGVPSLRIAFSDCDVTADADTVVLTLDGTTHALSRDAAGALADELDAALEARREFLRTAGKHRSNGSYVVSRRGADSAGNAKVFDSFRRLRRLYDRLPTRFDADDVGRTGITGSRRHMVVRHFAEHPAFDCRIASRNPLAVEKTVDVREVDAERTTSVRTEQEPALPTD